MNRTCCGGSRNKTTHAATRYEQAIECGGAGIELLPQETTVSPALVRGHEATERIDWAMTEE
jgi:hypothetical protein